MFTTRLARIDDATSIAEIQISSWTDRGLKIASIDDLDHMSAQWAAAIQDQQGEGRIIVVEKDGSSTLVGCAGIVKSPDSQNADLILLEVLPAERRQQVGSRLINACADIAKGFGADFIEAWIGIEEVAAIQLLEGSGWERTGAERLSSGKDSEYLREEVKLHTSLR